MVNMQTNRSPLETEPLTKLLFRYSVPTTLTLMVNYIYNIVDQIFVGQGVGITGMAAINIAFPLSILVNAVSLLLGDGCAANVSLCLGRREQENANKIFGQAVTWIVASGIALAFICGIFAPHIVTLFGTTNTAYGESLAYMRVIAIGIPFQLICPAFTAMIRADGSPQYTMKCMMAGAVVNIILDPVFIFGLKMGVVGAGIATVIGEMVAGILCLLYLRRLQSVQLEKGALRPTWPVLKMILQLGFPSLLTQGLTALVQIVLNNLMRVYGEASIYGSDMALSVYGMMMKVYQLAHSMFVGVSSAIQPINGYNFGAKNYQRVRQTYRLATGIAVVISAVWFLLPGNREADKIITYTADSTGRVTDSFGTGNVQIDWIRRRTAGGTCGRYGYLSAVCGFGTNGIQTVGKSWDVVKKIIFNVIKARTSMVEIIIFALAFLLI